MDNIKTVLVVDDDELNRMTLEDMLSGQYTVLQAENGRQALEFLYSYRNAISAIILALQMPVMNGYEFMSVQQADDIISDIPVIVITQQEDENNEIEALSYGALDFLTKPYNKKIILNRITAAINIHDMAHFMNTINLDALTGCYNRIGFNKKASILIQEDTDQDYDVIAFDIEQFRVINDLYGLQEGDKLLRYLARIMQNFAKARGGFCGRMSGDRFMMLIARTEGYEDIMAKYIEEAMNRYPLQMEIVLRFGIYQVDDRDLDVSAMYDRAALAVKKIKGIYGVPYTYFDASMREKLLFEKEITYCMRDALQNEQFVVYLQSKCDLKTERIVGAEALVRWIHPQRGIIPPYQFVPIFESNGFITEVDMYVWEKVCYTLKRWKDEGRVLIPISVNVSRADLCHSDIAEKVLELINKYELEPQLLHLEITETVYTQNQKQIVDMVNKFKSLGFIVEMDDFGSGYSSLNMLTELSVDVLKLDMRFLENFQDKKSKGNILEFVLSLAKSLELMSVAEGVETKEVVEELKRLNCEIGQGYYFSKPIPIDEFEKLFDKQGGKSMSDLLSKMNNYGADVKATMERFMNDEDLYLTCLKAFADEKAFNELGNALDQKDYKTAFEQAHMLKGVAANLGLTPVYKAICSIVEPLRVDKYDGLDVLYIDVMEKKKEYTELLKTL